MKEMVYTLTYEEPTVLDFGFHKNHRFWVVSLGHHPCCYIEILKRDYLYGLSYEEADSSLRVHGGLTYDNNKVDWGEEPHEHAKGWILGWDYAHCGDYYKSPFKGLGKGKKWTTEELHDDCINAIDQVVPYIWK